MTREVELAAHSHAVSEGKSLDLNLGMLALRSVPLTTVYAKWKGVPAS